MPLSPRHSSGARPNASPGLFSCFSGQQPASVFSGLPFASALLSQGPPPTTSATVLAMGMVMVVAEMLTSLGGRVPVAASREGVDPLPRQDEIRWIQAHAGDLAALDGQWIVVEGFRLVASGLRLVDVVAEAEAQGIQNPFVYRVQKEHPEIAYMGL